MQFGRVLAKNEQLLKYLLDLGNRGLPSPIRVRPKQRSRSDLIAGSIRLGSRPEGVRELSCKGGHCGVPVSRAFFLNSFV